MYTSDKFKRIIYIQALAIILEKLEIPFEFLDNQNLKFNLHVIKDLNIDTTDMDLASIDNLIKLILTK